MPFTESFWLSSFRWRRRVLAAALDAMARVGEFTPDLRAARHDVEVIRDIPYGPHPVAHTLDIYRPRDMPRPLPVMIYIHGGGFVLCSKETHRGLALINAQRAGYLVFNINYRLAPDHPFPAAIADACAAYRWVVRNAERYGGDPARIVVAGESAGGNLALGVAIACCYPRPEPWAHGLFDLVPPRGVMPLMPYLQVTEPWRRCAERPTLKRWTRGALFEISRAYLGGLPSATPELLMADPIRVLEECGPPQRDFPKIFAAAGTADLCCSDVRRLELACRRLHLSVQTSYFPNEGHGFHALHWRNAARRLWRRSLVFLQRVQVAVPGGDRRHEPTASAPWWAFPLRSRTWQVAILRRPRVFKRP